MTRDEGRGTSDEGRGTRDTSRVTRHALLIKGGRVLDPGNGIDEVCDVLVRDGKIAAVGKVEIGKTEAGGAEVLDAAGLLVVPGFVDLHVHLRDPGREDEESIESGARAAAHGGFTSIFSMPNTDPVADRASVIDYINRRVIEFGRVNVFPVGSLSKLGKGKELSEMGEMYRSGAIAFSNDGLDIESSQLIRRAMQYAKIFQVALLLHCENKSLSTSGQMNESKVSTRLGLCGMPKIAEEIAIQNYLSIAKYENARIHICHVSTAGSVAIIKKAKKDNVSVTAEVCPHHLLFTDEELSSYDTNFKMNPPLREKEDVKALIEGLKDGTIDAIATDHAPHARHEKEQEFENAPFGITGLETAFSSLFTGLGNKLPLNLLIEKMSSSPARIARLNKGQLKVGDDADITIIDPNKEIELTRDFFYSKSLNTPFLGRALKSAIKYTIVGGKFIVRDYQIVE